MLNPHTQQYTNTSNTYKHSLQASTIIMLHPLIKCVLHLLLGTNLKTLNLPGPKSTHLRRLADQYSLIAALTPSQNGAVLKALEQRLSLVQGVGPGMALLAEQHGKPFEEQWGSMMSPETLGTGPPGTGKTHVACVSWQPWHVEFNSSMFSKWLGMDCPDIRHLKAIDEACNYIIAHCI